MCHLHKSLPSIQANLVRVLFLVFTTLLAGIMSSTVHVTSRNTPSGGGSISGWSADSFGSGPYATQYLQEQPVQRPQPTTGDWGTLLWTLVKRQMMEGEMTHGAESNSSPGMGEMMMDMIRGLVQEDPGFDGSVKILLALFPFLIAVIFVPLFLVTIGVLLIPFVAYDNFRSLSTGSGSRSFSSLSKDPWPQQTYLKLIDSITKYAFSE